jgi:CheY-like chemotaxis protein
VSAAPVRVALVEDNAVFREALELLLGLRTDIDVVGAVEDGTQVVEMCTTLEPDVVIMDFRLPGARRRAGDAPPARRVPGRRRHLPHRPRPTCARLDALSKPARSRA